MREEDRGSGGREVRGRPCPVPRTHAGVADLKALEDSEGDRESFGDGLEDSVTAEVVVVLGDTTERVLPAASLVAQVLRAVL